MNAHSAEIEHVVQLLSKTPARIASATKGLQPAQLSFKPDEETWSMCDILAHLRACADVWGKSILVMLTQDHPTLRYVSPRTRMKKTNYAQLNFYQSLAAFTTQRYVLLDSLQSLQINDWSRGATFTATTRGREQTVYSYAQRLALHENDHCEQIEELLK